MGVMYKYKYTYYIEWYYTKNFERLFYVMCTYIFFCILSIAIYFDSINWLVFETYTKDNFPNNVLVHSVYQCSLAQQV